MRDAQDFPFPLISKVQNAQISMVRLSIGISSACHLQNGENKDGENRISGEYGVLSIFFL